MKANNPARPTTGSKPLQTWFFPHSSTHSRRRPVVLLWRPGFRTWYAHEGRRGHGETERGNGRKREGRGERGEGNNKKVARQVAEGPLAPLSRPNGDGTRKSRDPIGAATPSPVQLTRNPLYRTDASWIRGWGGRSRAWTPAPVSAGSSRPRCPLGPEDALSRAPRAPRTAPRVRE